VVLIVGQHLPPYKATEQTFIFGH